ncbi:MAG: pyridoxal-phosphate dependent enzyme [Planctomycetota bacterium]|jgi:1-aminocyclopropane-1-carboxylate deaminase/D-cysteine desulfhydrase-like pyridoxal-dependent ACC family enzyme
MSHSAQSITDALSDIPHAGLSVEPTPIYRLDTLSNQLSRDIFVLREDMTGFALGGNKVRKLDYLVADALAHNADTLVTTMASSFSRNAAAAAKARGLDLHVILPSPESNHNALSRAFFELYGTTLHYVDAPSQDEFARAYQEIVDSLRSDGRTIYEMPSGGSTEIGTLGYVRVFEHIVRHTETTGTHFDTIVLPTGSAGTQAGLIVGQCISEYPTRIIGVAVSQPQSIQHERVRSLAESTSRLLGASFDESNVIVDDSFLADGYPIPSPESEEAVQRLAQSEGILLDAIYGGKAAAWLLHAASTGEIEENTNTLFINTGGNSGIFYDAR